MVDDDEKEMSVAEVAYSESWDTATTVVEQDADSSPGPSIEDLQRRCEFLLEELTSFAEHLRKLGRENSVELRGPSGAIEAELKALKKLAKADEDESIQARRKHILRSSNVPYHEAVWATAKRSSGVVAFNKRIFWAPPKRAHKREDLRTKYRHSALVDIVAQDGEEWVKVSNITETRLLFELAKQGWESADASSGSEEDESSLSSRQVVGHTEGVDDDDDDRVSILRMAEDLSKAAASTRVRYKHPTVRFILSRITRGRLKEIDKLLSTVAETGATVLTSSDIAPLDVTTPSLADALPTMLVDEFASFTNTLNIDCTILLALVSDLSHAHIECQPWFHRATTRQIEMEEKETLLPTSLYPAMGSRRLVCTPEAAKRMREIVETIGTATERKRTCILMGDAVVEAESQSGESPTPSQAELVKRFQELSDYSVPTSWQLPVHVIDDGGNEDEAAAAAAAPSTLPRLADVVAGKLSDINKSVFLYGWRVGLTTITSNRTVAKTIEDTIEANRREGEDDIVGPPVWLCPMARSLVGKEKKRRPG